MLRVLGEKLLGKLLSMLPGFLVKWFVKVRQLEEDFEVDLASPAPVTLLLNPAVPQIEIVLRMTNKSAIAVTVDRVLFEVWADQMFLESARLRRVAVTPKKTEGYVFSRFNLSGIQRDAVKRQLQQNGRLSQNLRLQAAVFCDSKIGPFVIEKHFNIDPQAVPIH